MMNKAIYTVPAVIITRIESTHLLSSSPLSVGYSDETTTGDANAREYDFDDDEEDYDPWARSRNTDCDW